MNEPILNQKENEDAIRQSFSDLLQKLAEDHDSNQATRLKEVNSLVTASSILRNTDADDAFSVVFERIQNGEITGDADDYHNIAVTFARHEEPTRASLICQTGLKTWPGNIDLNADALTYMMDAGDLSAARILADRMQENCPNRSRWNWRGFSFLLDYYLTVYPDEQKELINDLIEDYKRYLPQEEKAYLCDANRHEYFGDIDKAITSLEDAVSNLNAPQCALKLTDLYFERGKYVDAIRTATLGIAFAAEPQPSIRTAYLLFLRALSKDALYLKNGEASEEDAKKIIEEYALAKKYVSSSERAIIDLRMDIISTYSGVACFESN